jgi:hypothetical protein
MSWSLSVEAVPASEFGAAVDRAKASGELSAGIAGLHGRRQRQRPRRVADVVHGDGHGIRR